MAYLPNVGIVPSNTPPPGAAFIAETERNTRRVAQPRRADQVDKVMRCLTHPWPAAFTDPAPLAVCVNGQIRVGMEKGVTTIAIKRAVHRWVASGGYLSALANGEERRNLDGSLAGLPSHDHRRRAQQQLGTMCAQVTP